MTRSYTFKVQSVTRALICLGFPFFHFFLISDACQRDLQVVQSQIQHTIPKCRSYVLFPILQLYMRHVLKCLLIIVHLKKFLDVKHGLLNVVTEPARVLHVTETKMSCEFRKATAGSSFSSAFTVSAYCVWAGELAGDVECYKCFSNNYIRHAITIIGHLQTEKDTFELLHKALSIRTY